MFDNFVKIGMSTVCPSSTDIVRQRISQVNGWSMWEDKPLTWLSNLGKNKMPCENSWCWLCSMVSCLRISKGIRVGRSSITHKSIDKYADMMHLSYRYAYANALENSMSCYANNANWIDVMLGWWCNLNWCHVMLWFESCFTFYLKDH